MSAFYGCISQQQNMMQDFVRTATYHRAILQNHVDFRDKVVLDVGCGTGILSFFAVQAGARRVYAVEASSVAQYAEILVKNNHLSDKIIVLPGIIEEISLPEAVDVIISEPMGYMLFNERMLESYLHSKKWLKANGKMFPTFSDIHLAPFSDDQLYMEHYSRANFWYQQCFYGVNLSSLRAAAVDEYFRQPIVDTFDIRILMARSVKYTVNFMDAKEADLHRVEIPFVFQMTQSGLIHGLAFWFDVAFVGSLVTVWLSTAPTEPLTHWYQVRCLLQTPLFAKEGETLSGRVLFVANKRQSYDIQIVALVNQTGFRSGNILDLKNPFFRVSMMEVKAKQKFTGKGTKTSQEKNRFYKNNDSGSSKTFPRKVVKEGGPKITSKNFQKSATKPGKKGVKQFRNKQQGDKIPKNKFQQANKFNKKRKFQPDSKSDESAAKKPKWDDFKKKKKELKQSRQLSDRTNYDIVVRAKQIWEIVRRKDCDKEKRVKLMSDLQKLIQGKIKTIAFAHDSTRVIQCYIQFGNEEQRKQAFEELRDDLVELSKAKYSRNIVKKFLMYGALIFFLLQSADHPTLDKVLKVQPEKLELIMDEMKQILTPMAQKEAVIKHSLVHKVFLDFFTYAPPKLRSEMIEAIREAVVYLAHTHDGARVAMHCLWHGTPKDRKVIVKTMKTYVEKVANGQYSHLVLLAAFDCIDDTKLVKQIIISEIISSLSNILNDKYGRKVLLYLLSPRDPAHTVREIIEVLQKGDGNAHSKKDTEIRRRELLESISPALLSYLQGHAQEMVLDKSACVLVPCILGAAIGDTQPAMNAVASLAAAELHPGGKDGELHIAEHPAGHLVLKWLIEQDKKMKENGREGCFAKTLVEHVGMKNLKSWAGVNRGAIILSGLLQSSDPEVASKVKAGLKSLIPTLQKNRSTSKGVEMLLEKLSV
ncbi:Pumilio domain-containing protein KIAA0020 [Myotis davidii]|uniref:Histone-arginine methyltransferase CARM1 n=1 Tax=Myotis davidii TaxID=225400 RepID=L5LL75_MYODS|nr:Pumilio domain-containing protein KIAA0020 [Myotis davidii]